MDRGLNLLNAHGVRVAVVFLRRFQVMVRELLHLQEVLLREG